MQLCQFCSFLFLVVVVPAGWKKTNCFFQNSGRCSWWERWRKWEGLRLLQRILIDCPEISNSSFSLLVEDDLFSRKKMRGGEKITLTFCHVHLHSSPFAECVNCFNERIGDPTCFLSLTPSRYHTAITLPMFSWGWSCFYRQSFEENFKCSKSFDVCKPLHLVFLIHFYS